jgi:hypothetical protein
MSLKTYLGNQFHNKPENRPVFEASAFAGAEKRDIEKAFARLFGSDDGRLVLGHLQSMAFMRAFGAESSDAQIRYAEGQRAFVAQMMRLVNAGRENN